MNLLQDYSLLWAELGVLLLGFISLWLAPGMWAWAFLPFSRIGKRINAHPTIAFALAFAAPLLLRLLAWPPRSLRTKER